MKLFTSEGVKKIDLKDTKTLTILIILCIVLFAILYVWFNKKNTTEGFSQYNINSGDLVSLYGLDNVVVGSSNPISLTSTLNSLIDSRNAGTLSNTYAKTSDFANLTSNVAILQSTLNNFQTRITNDLSNINQIVTSNITLMNNNLTSNITLMNNNLTSGITLMNNNLTSNVALMNNNLTSNVALMNNNLTSNIALITNKLNNFNNIAKFVANINYTRTTLTLNVPNVYNLGLTFLEIFNWNNPRNIKNTSNQLSPLPILKPNTTYIFHVSASGYAWKSITKLVCLDDNNSNTLSISNINNNNGFYSDMYHINAGCNFMVTSSPNNPNIILGYAQSPNNLVQDQGDTTSIIIYELISY